MKWWSVTQAKKDKKGFDDLAKPGIAVIKGYDSDSSADNTCFSVKVLDSGDEHLYSLHGLYNVKRHGKTDTNYPHFALGDKVHVMYYRKRQFGLSVLYVNLDEKKYHYPNQK